MPQDLIRRFAKLGVITDATWDDTNDKLISKPTRLEVPITLNLTEKWKQTNEP